jgi:hypothetical protein
VKKPTAKTDLRITDQRRIRDGVEYHLACDGARLTVHVHPTPSDGPGWRVGASMRRGVGMDAVHLDEVGTSRTDTFRALATTWQDDARCRDLSMFDWEEVESLLTSVRAL